MDQQIKVTLPCRYLYFSTKMAPFWALFFFTVTCNPPCENGRCIDNSTNSTKCYCEIGWEGTFCNKSNGGEKATKPILDQY